MTRSAQPTVIGAFVLGAVVLCVATVLAVGVTTAGAVTARCCCTGVAPSIKMELLVYSGLGGATCCG